MGRITPIAVGEKTAAKMMDMSPLDFRRLVSAGSLPGPVVISETHERWRVADLVATLNGEAMQDEDITW
jgi:hypothetical protein